MTPVRAEDASAGGLFLTTGTAQGYLAGVSLRAGGGADATATVRDGGAAGNVIVVLSAPAKGADHFVCPSGPVIYTGGVHVTVTGVGAEVIVYGA